MGWRLDNSIRNKNVCWCRWLRKTFKDLAGGRFLQSRQCLSIIWEMERILLHNGWTNWRPVAGRYGRIVGSITIYVHSTVPPFRMNFKHTTNLPNRGYQMDNSGAPTTHQHLQSDSFRQRYSLERMHRLLDSVLNKILKSSTRQHSPIQAQSKSECTRIGTMAARELSRFHLWSTHLEIFAAFFFETCVVLIACAGTTYVVENIHDLSDAIGDVRYRCSQSCSHSSHRRIKFIKSWMKCGRK